MSGSRTWTCCMLWPNCTLCTISIKYTVCTNLYSRLFFWISNLETREHNVLDIICFFQRCSWSCLTIVRSLFKCFPAVSSPFISVVHSIGGQFSPSTPPEKWMDSVWVQYAYWHHEDTYVVFVVLFYSFLSLFYFMSYFIIMPHFFCFALF